MTDKQYITGAAVLRALADGKRVRNEFMGSDNFIALGESGEIEWESGSPYGGALNIKWTVVEEPATDAELVAEMRRLAETVITPVACAAYALCADMLEKRSIKP